MYQTHKRIENIRYHYLELIVTANVGCQLHLGDGSSVPVRHWLEVVDIGEDQ